MPFTLSHPAAVVPLARRSLPFSALVVGSMTPDFPYFLVPSAMFGFGHTVKGVFVVCLPLGLITLWLFHQFLKLPLLSLLPPSHRLRLAPHSKEFHCRTLWDFVAIVAALIIGAFTHTIWDSFTHYSGWWYEKMPSLRTPIFNTSDSAFFLFDILQYLSTAFGALFLLVCYFQWFRSAVPGTEDVAFHLSEKHRLGFVVAMVGIALGIALTNGFMTVKLVSITSWIQPLARHVGVAVIRVGAVEVLIYCAYWQWIVGRIGRLGQINSM